MSLSVPTNDNGTNSGVSQPLTFDTGLLKVSSGAGLNQVRGINQNGSTGNGIPAHVTDVSCNTANASTGATSTMTITFRRNPADSAYAGVTVWAKGYQGNQSLVQLAAGVDSPVNVVVTNTGESISLQVQAYGNGGYAPLSTAPTIGARLPQAAAGGFGTTTVTNPTPNVTIPDWWDSLESLRGFSVGGLAYGVQAWSIGTAINANGNFNTIIPATATAPQAVQLDIGSNPGLCFLFETDAGTSPAFYNSFGVLKNFKTSFAVTQLAFTRAWAVFTDISPLNTSPGGLMDDAPVGNLIGFRYNAYVGDVNWICVLSDGTTFQEVDSGVPVVAGVPAVLYARRTGNAWEFFVDGNLSATINSGLPGDGVNCIPAFGASNTDGASGPNSTQIGYLWWTNTA